jgi:hypothetical protein
VQAISGRVQQGPTGLIRVYWSGERRCWPRRDSPKCSWPRRNLARFVEMQRDLSSFTVPRRGMHSGWPLKIGCIAHQGPCSRFSITPLLLSQRQTVKRLLVELPVRHKPIHQRDKTCVVGRLQQVHHLVDQHVLQALPRFLGQVGVQPNIARPGVATAPLGFIRCTKKRCTFTPNSGSHFASSGGTACLSCSRYHASKTACRLASSVPGRTRSTMVLCFSSIPGAASASTTSSR